MSTEIYVACMDHDPPLPHDQASGTLLSIATVTKDIANRERLIAMYEDDLMEWPDGDRSHTFRFMLAHRDCRLGILDERGLNRTEGDGS